MGTSKFVNANQADDMLDVSGFEDTAYSQVEEKETPKSGNSGKARKAIEQLLEEKRLREILKDDFDDLFEA